MMEIERIIVAIKSLRPDYLMAFAIVACIIYLTRFCLAIFKMMHKSMETKEDANVALIDKLANEQSVSRSMIEELQNQISDLQRLRYDMKIQMLCVPEDMSRILFNKISQTKDNIARNLVEKSGLINEHGIVEEYASEIETRFSELVTSARNALMKDIEDSL